MCGRFERHSSVKRYLELFEAVGTVRELTPSYNVAPSQSVLACKTDPQASRELVMLHWGLIPHWAKDAKIGYKMINARAETVAEKPAYRDAFKHRRCLIGADGFYEWKAEGKGKQPYYIHRRDGEPFAFAGLWERWPGPEGEPIESCTIIVCPPNAVAAEIHDRMPVVLSPSDYASWLDTSSTRTDLEGLLIPAPAGDWEAYPVSREVNRPANNRPEMIERL